MYFFIRFTTPGYPVNENPCLFATGKEDRSVRI